MIIGLKIQNGAIINKIIIKSKKIKFLLMNKYQIYNHQLTTKTVMEYFNYAAFIFHWQIERAMFWFKEISTNNCLIYQTVKILIFYLAT